MKLTDLQCKSAKPKEKPYKLSDGGGMFLDVRPSGSKYWRLKYRIYGKEKLLAIGVYPEVSLADARGKRMDARRLISDNVDPSLEKKKKKALAKINSENNFRAIAEEWFENRRTRWTENYALDIWKRLETDVLPSLGNYPVTDIKAPLILSVIRKIESRGAVEVAKRQLQKCGEIFRYAIGIGVAEVDPTYGLKEVLRPQKTTHYAALDVKELPEFLDALKRNDARLYPYTRNALKLMMMTFVRTSELINARWEEVDFENALWTIPAERMKMRKEHLVPLSKQAIEILQTQKELVGKWEWVFPSLVRPQQSMSNNTILGAIRRLGFKGRMTGHGFRALAMSAIKQELGYRHEVVDRQLAHAPRSKIDRAYDRADFFGRAHKDDARVG